MGTSQVFSGSGTGPVVEDVKPDVPSLPVVPPLVVDDAAFEELEALVAADAAPKRRTREKIRLEQGKA